MRLIDTTTLKLTEVFEHNAKPYAILSHTWGSEEISFQEIQTGSMDVKKDGYRKISYCCWQARKDGYQFAWVDTCCIDKSSSAELSESINSMYKWYQKAAVCYAYLADVRKKDQDLNSALHKSRWFTRGWTLQELIAPSNVLFYLQDWTYLGTKTDLAPLLVEITGIASSALSTSNIHGQGFSIAQRMSWASQRITTRSEDLAYCLMGIFDINMPLLYGEGGIKAFFRLQEEILKSSEDQTLFCWGQVGPQLYSNAPHDWEEFLDPPSGLDRHAEGGSGLLAESPAQFVNFGHMRHIERDSKIGSVTMTNKGVQLSSFFISRPLMVSIEASSECIALLNCNFDNDRNSHVGIWLQHGIGGQYSRTHSNPMEVPLRLLSYAVEATVHVKSSEKAPLSSYPPIPQPITNNIFIVVPKYIGSRTIKWKLQDIIPPTNWREREQYFQIKLSNQYQCALFSYSYQGAPEPVAARRLVIAVWYQGYSISVTRIAVKIGGDSSLESLYKEFHASNPWPKRDMLDFHSESAEFLEIEGGRRGYRPVPLHHVSHVKVSTRVERTLEKWVCVVVAKYWMVEDSGPP